MPFFCTQRGLASFWRLSHRCFSGICSVYKAYIDQYFRRWRIALSLSIDCVCIDWVWLLSLAFVSGKPTAAHKSIGRRNFYFHANFHRALSVSVSRENIYTQCAPENILPLFHIAEGHAGKETRKISEDRPGAESSYLTMHRTSRLAIWDTENVNNFSSSETISAGLTNNSPWSYKFNAYCIQCVWRNCRS